MAEMSAVRRRALFRLWKPAFLLISVAVAVLGIFLIAREARDRSRSRHGLRALVALSESVPHRPSPARLSGNFPYKPAAPARRGDVERLRIEQSLKFLELAAIVEDRGDAASVEQLHAAGVARIFLGSDEASDRLKAALERSGQQTGAEVTAAILNDLAVVHFERGRTGEKKSFIVALDFLEEAWAMQRTPATAWTRALVLEELNLPAAAVRAWQQYLAIDPSSEWTAEARTKMAQATRAASPRRRVIGNELSVVCAAGDRSGVARFVATHAKEARELAEEELLPGWAEHTLNGSGERAAADLRCAELIGEALEQRFGEGLIVDTARHISATTSPNGVAAAMLVYRDGRKTYRRRDSARAEALLQDAEERLRRAASPFAVLADVYHAGALHWSNRFGDVADSLAGDPCRAPRRYLAACGLSRWIAGLASVQTGRPGDSIAHYAEAIDVFRTLGDAESTASVLGLRAETLDLLTSFDEAWDDRLEAVATFPGSLAGRPTLWKSVATAAVRDHYVRAADIVLGELAADARERGDALYVAEATMWQALARTRADDRYVPDVAALQRAVAAIEDSSVRARAEANLGIVLAEIDVEARRVTLDGLDRALAFYRDTADRYNTLAVLGRRADARASARQYAAADADFVEAVRELEGQAADVEDPFLRVMFNDRAQQLFRAASDVQLARGDPAAALWFSDSARRLTIPGRDGNAACRHGQSSDTPASRGRALVLSVPSGVTVVHQELRADRLVTWTIRDGRMSFATTPIDAASVVRDVEQLVALARRNDPQRAVSVARRLYDSLLRDTDATSGTGLLVYSPDSVLRRVPLAMLHDGGQYLVEKRPVAITRSVGMLSCSRTASAPATALLVAPSPDAASEPLPAAQREITALSGIYGRRAEKLEGNVASASAFLRMARSADVIHVAAHGRVDKRPLHNALEFSAERLRSFDVLSTRFERSPVVVLAACRTTDDSEGRASVSLATAFVASGASAVVGSLWDIDDDGSVELFREFHQALARGVSAHDSLRDAQRDAIRRRESTAIWAAFQVHI